jgi:hypothetical protein
MTPRRAVAVGTIVTFALGLLLAGYNGTTLYVWYTTGKVEILGKLEHTSYAPIFFAKSFVENCFGCFIGVCLLIFAMFEAAVLLKSPSGRKQS